MHVQMIIATPAQLNDIITNHPSDIDLGDVEALVLDEVDCLLQMGFESQVQVLLWFVDSLFSYTALLLLCVCTCRCSVVMYPCVYP